MEPDSTVRLGEELIPPNEARDIDELLTILREIQEQKDRRQRPVPRELHPKQHGCVRAELIIDPNLPRRFGQGIFREPKTYVALVRF